MLVFQSREYGTCTYIQIYICKKNSSNMFSNSSITLNIDYTTMSYIRTGLKYTNTDTIFSKYLFKIFTGKNIK